MLLLLKFLREFCKPNPSNQMKLDAKWPAKSAQVSYIPHLRPLRVKQAISQQRSLAPKLLVRLWPT